MSTVTVYSKPHCVQCDMTERALEAQGIAYEKIDLTMNDEALGTVKELGYLSAPVVVTNNGHWSGFRPDKIKGL